MWGRNKTTSFMVVVCLAATSFVVIGFPSMVTGVSSTLYVGGCPSCSGSYSTIQAAVNAANAGDTVFVYSGTYHENIIVKKSINLIGEAKHTTIIQDGTVVIDASGVAISGFKISNTNRTYSTSIHVSGNHTIIENNILENNPQNSYGVLCHSDFNVIRDNVINDVDNGTALWGGSNNTIIRNVYINNSGFGVGGSGRDNIIYHNTFINNRLNAYDENTKNIWYSETLKEGNYWDDFDEPSEGAWDNNSDGIVDSLYTILGGSNQDLYPLMYPLYGRTLTACRGISPHCGVPGESVTVRVTLTAHDDISNPVLDEDVPSGWTVTPVDNAGFNYIPSTTKWIHVGAWTSGFSATIEYNLTFPEAQITIYPPPCGVYHIHGNVSANDLGPFPVDGDNDIEDGEDEDTAPGFVAIFLGLALLLLIYIRKDKQGNRLK